MMIQDIYRREPWKMLVCCILLNQTTGVQVKKMMREFFRTFPTLNDLRDIDENTLAGEIESLGMQNVKAKRIKAFVASFTEDVDVMKDSVIGYPGLGSYACESADVFICRNNDVKPEDKEISSYLSKIETGDVFVEGMRKYLELCGVERVTVGCRVKEILNHSYHFFSNVFWRITDDRLPYVKDKLIMYRTALRDAIKRLERDNTSRQAIIQFDQSDPLPNCTVSIQFQIKDDILFTTVYQRSQDIDKVEMDCEIFALMSLEVIKAIEGVDDYRVAVFVGNFHLYL